MKLITRLIRVLTVLAILFSPSILLATTDIDTGGVVVQRIRFIGLSRITQATAHNYIALKKGQVMTDKKSIEVIKSLYKTGFFSDVRVDRQGHTVLIYVKERATIGVITFSGNKTIKNADLLKALNKSGIDEGQPYQPADVHMIVEGMKQQYEMMGYHNVIVDARVKQEPRNRVAIDHPVHRSRT